MVRRPSLPPAANSAITTAVGLLAASLRSAAQCVPRSASRFPAEAARRPVRAARRVTAGLPVPPGVRREYEALAERGAAVAERLRASGPTASPPVSTPLEPSPEAGQPASPDTALPVSGETSPEPALPVSGATSPESALPASPEPSMASLRPVPARPSPARVSATPPAVSRDDDPTSSGATAPVDQTEEPPQSKAAPAEAPLDPDQLPLPDFDHLTLGSIRGRLRRLSLPELVQLREYEGAHGNRPPIVTMLDNRIAKLTAEQGSAAF